MTYKVKIGTKTFKRQKDVSAWLETHEEIKKWFAWVNRNKSDKGGMSSGTKTNYLGSMRFFCELTQLSPTELINEVWQEKKTIAQADKPVLKSVAENRVLDFWKWLTKSKPEGRGFGWNTARRHFAAIQSFYHALGFRLEVKTPKQEVAFQSEVFEDGETPKSIVTKLYWQTKSLRDRAIIACGLSSALGVGDLRDLNYVKVKKQLEGGIIPIVLKGQRKKTKEPYITFFGSKAIQALKTYLADRERRYGKLKPKAPLFVQDPRAVRNNNPKRVELHALQENFRKYAEELGYTNAENKQNPLKPTFLRDCFKQAMEDAGANPKHVKAMMGHTVGAVDQSYWKAIERQLKATFLKFERFIEPADIEDSLKTNAKLAEMETRMQERLNDVEQENTQLKAGQVHIQEQLERFASLTTFLIAQQPEILDQWKEQIVGVDLKTQAAADFDPEVEAGIKDMADAITALRRTLGSMPWVSKRKKNDLGA